MPQSKALTTNQTVIGPGAWHHLNPELSNRGFVVSVSGGTPTASVSVDVSNDGGLTFAARLSFPSVTGNDTDVDANQPFPLVRANVTELGAGAAVNVSVTAA